MTKFYAEFGCGALTVEGCGPNTGRVLVGIKIVLL